MASERDARILATAIGWVAKRAARINCRCKHKQVMLKNTTYKTEIAIPEWLNNPWTWLGLYLLLSYIASWSLCLFGPVENSCKDGDSALIMWTMQQELSHLFKGEWLHFYDSQIFYPLDNTLLFTETHIGALLLAIPFYVISGFNPFVAFGVSIQAPYFLGAWFMYLLGRELGLKGFLAGCAGLLFAYTSFRGAYTSYLFIIGTHWFILCLLYLHKYFKSYHLSHLLWASLFFCLQISSSAHLFIMFSVELLVIFALLCIYHNSYRRREFFYHLILPVGLSLLTILFCYLPYYYTHQNMGFAEDRGIADHLRYGATLVDLVKQPNSLLLSFLNDKLFATPFDIGWGPKTTGSQGIVVILLLGGIGLILALVRGKISLSGRQRSLFVALILMILSLLVTATLYVSGYFTYLSTTHHIPADFVQIPSLLSANLFVWFSIILCFFLHIIWNKQPFLLALIAASLVVLLISFGPLFRFNSKALCLNLPYFLFYHLFPGFSGIRDISRWAGLLPIGLALPAVMVLRYFMQKGKVLPFIFLSSLLIADCIPRRVMTFLNQPTPYVQPAVYTWLQDYIGKNNQAAVLELPTYPGAFEKNGGRIRSSTLHHFNLINGHSGHDWNGHRKLSYLTQQASDSFSPAIEAFGPEYIIVHSDNGSFPAYVAGDNFKNFNPIFKSKEAIVFQATHAKVHLATPELGTSLTFYQHRHPEKGNRILVGLNSPETYYVSKDKMSWKLMFKNEKGMISYHSLIIYPTLWQHSLWVPKTQAGQPVLTNLSYLSTIELDDSEETIKTITIMGKESAVQQIPALPEIYLF